MENKVIEAQLMEQMSITMRMIKELIDRYDLKRWKLEMRGLRKVEI